MKHNHGYTTGSCAAGAAKGAAYGLFQGAIPDTVDLTTLKDYLQLYLLSKKHVAKTQGLQ